MSLPLAATRRARLCRALVCGWTVLVSLAAVAACGAGVPRPVPVQVLSNYERNGNTVRRDCGYSSPLPGKLGWSLWLFCDTVIASVRGGKTERLILGTDTAAAGPYRAGYAPARLSEIPTPPTPLALPGAGPPQPFLPGPQQLLRPGTTLPCAGPGAYPASWISGVAREPRADAAANLLISYDNYCVTGNADELTAEGFGLIEYDPAGNLLSSPAVVFGSGTGLQLPPQQVLGSPVFTGDGYLYLFGFCHAGPPPAGCGRGSVFLVRTVAQPSYWRNPLTYQYWTGGGWSPDEAAARTLIPAGHPFGISVGDYAADGHGLVMVEQTSLAGGFQVWQARSPAGPWRRGITGVVPCSRGAQHGTEALCRAVIGHPELSTRGQLLVSYFDPGNYHVDVSAYPWLPHDRLVLPVSNFLAAHQAEPGTRQADGQAAPPRGAAAMTLASRIAARLPERLLVRLVSLTYPRFEPEIRRLDEVCGRSGTMVDIGGWYGPWARRLVRRADRVVIVEPTQLHQVLRRTLPPAVGVIAAAASDHRGVAEIWLPPADEGMRGVSSLHRRDIHGRSMKVPLVTVDGLGLRDVTFIKIDVDGHEIPVLHGAAETIKRDQPRLLVEVEQRIQPVTDVIGLLESWGYRGWVLPSRQWVPVADFPLAAHQARTCHVSDRGLLARALWPFPRYLNSVLFLPAGQLSGPA